MRKAIWIIGLFLLADFAWSCVNLLTFYAATDGSGVASEYKMRFTICFGISKGLMIFSPIPFFAFAWRRGDPNNRCGLRDTFENRRLLYRVLFWYVVSTEALTIIVLIIAISLGWINSTRFAYSLVV